MSVTAQSAKSITKFMNDPVGLAEFMDDPIGFFGESLTKMHSIPREELKELQRQAMVIRFQQHRESIEILRKLADRLGITKLNDFNDVVPLLFSHTAFKSYPAALIDNKRFDLMTKWLDKVTSHDLSHVDTEGCTSLDDWIDRLDEQTPLEVITSSGTTGTISIIPKDKDSATQGMVLWKMCLFQTFGKEPPQRSSTRLSMWFGPTTPAASSAICASPRCSRRASREVTRPNFTRCTPTPSTPI